MRVAVNVEQLLHRSPGGIGRYTARLVSVLPTLFPDDEVVAFAARHSVGDLRAAAAAAGLPEGGRGIVRLGLPRPVLYEAWHLLGLPPLTATGGPLAGAGVDVIHAPSLAVPPRHRTPLVVTIHDAGAALFPEAFSRRGRRFHTRGLAAANRRADLVIAVSQAAADEIATHSALPSDRLRVVPNGVDTVAVSPEQRAATLAQFGLDGAPYVLWIGSLEPRKGVGALVAALARLHAGGPRGRRRDVRLVLAGYPGWLGGGLIDPADRSRLGDRLVQLGPLGEGDLWALYSGATVFALPSRHEGFGLPVLEAMSQGTPVVCSDIPALREVAGDAARFAPPGDVEAWAEALGDLLDDPGERDRLGRAGMARSAPYSWERTVAATRRVYQEALGEISSPLEGQR